MQFARLHTPCCVRQNTGTEMTRLKSGLKGKVCYGKVWFLLFFDNLRTSVFGLLGPIGVITAPHEATPWTKCWPPGEDFAKLGPPSTLRWGWKQRAASVPFGVFP